MKNEHTAPIKLALIGVSGYGNCHYKSILQLAELGLVQLSAATVINQSEELEKCNTMRRMGCRLYDDYQLMLENEKGQIDLCAIPTGIGWHKSMTIAALNAGMHVLVEKPAAATPAEVDAMIAVQQATGLQVFVGFQNMYADLLWQMKERFLSGEFGKLQRIKVCALWPRPQSYYKRTSWAGKLYSNNIPILDSPANNAMAHFILMALFWGGNRRESVAEISNLETVMYRAQEIESFDTFSARATLPNSVELLINMSHSTEEFMPAEIIVETSNGNYYWNDKKGSSINDATYLPKKEQFPPFEETRIVMFQHICQQLKGHNSQVCNLDMARAHTKFIDQIHQNLKIQDVPENWIQNSTIDGEIYTQIRTVSTAIKQAHKHNTLLWEDGTPWRKNQTPQHLQHVPYNS